MADKFTGAELATCGECGIEGALEWVQRHFLEHYATAKEDTENEGLTDVLEGPLSPHFGDDSEIMDARLWSESSTILLIRLVEKNHALFEGSMKKIVWKIIATELSSMANKNFTAEQIDTKWKGLKRTYKKIKDHNAKTGKNRKSWQFFDIMDGFLSSRPEIISPATCSSESGFLVNKENEAVTPTSSRASTQASGSTSRKRKIEDSSDKRHREKINRLDRFLDLYQLSVEHQIGRKIDSQHKENQDGKD